MNIKFQGFELEHKGNGIQWDEYISRLENQCNKEIKMGPYNRVLSLTSVNHDEYILGLFVSIKDQKRYTALKRSGREFNLQARNLLDGERMADFNFFIINKNNYRGLYQYYHQSCSLRQFLNFLEREYFELRSEKFQELKKDESITDDKYDKKVSSLKSSILNTSLLVSPHTFRELVQELESIKEMKFDIAMEEDKRDFFKPLSGVTVKKTERYLFTPGMLAQIKSAIFEATRSPKIENVRVRGEEDGLEKILTLSQNIEDFGQYDYDTLTDHLNVDFTEFHKSKILKLLLSAAKSRPEVFGKLNEL